MKASLRLEAIGDNDTAMSRVAQSHLRAVGCSQIVKMFAIPVRHWCAEVTGMDVRYGMARSFISGKKDYQFANRNGSRGVFVYYVLESGRLYEIAAPQAWKRTDRYFCTVLDDGTIQRLTKEEARRWLQQRTNDRLELTY